MRGDSNLRLYSTRKLAIDPRTFTRAPDRASQRSFAVEKHFPRLSGGGQSHTVATALFHQLDRVLCVICESPT